MGRSVPSAAARCAKSFLMTVPISASAMESGNATTRPSGSCTILSGIGAHAPLSDRAAVSAVAQHPVNLALAASKQLSTALAADAGPRNDQDTGGIPHVKLKHVPHPADVYPLSAIIFLLNHL